MKNFSIYSGARKGAFALAVLALGALAPAAEAGKNKNYDPTYLLQPFLSERYARWLIGPIAHMAEQEEVEAFLTLRSDEEAERFIAAFWAERNPYPERPDNEAREAFEKRIEEADRQFTEGSVSGYQTDRGTIYVLYGPPEETDYDIAPYYGGPPLEVWEYPKKADKGLDGKKPDRRYEFIKRGELTKRYIPGRETPQERFERERSQRRRPGF